MKKKIMGALLVMMSVLTVSGCADSGRNAEENTSIIEEEPAPASEQGDTEENDMVEDDSLQSGAERGDTVTEGTEKYRGFILDNVLHSEDNGDIHYNLYVPDSYDGSEPYALFFTLPGYEGLYFQGVGENLYSENFGFEAQNYIQDMIIVAPQLSDWGETSADQTIALVEYFLANYNIDESRVFGEGYSGGGETMSQVMGKRPDLFTAYLQCSSQWDGDYEPVVESRTPVYFAIGVEDEYYGSGPSREAYESLREMYQDEGLTDEEIDEILVLDIKDADYFESRGMTNQHGGGGLFAQDGEIMGWLFNR